jgi:hypothetical protein
VNTLLLRERGAAVFPIVSTPVAPAVIKILCVAMPRVVSSYVAALAGTAANARGVVIVSVRALKTLQAVYV